MRRTMRLVVASLLAACLLVGSAAVSGAVSHEGTWRGGTSQSYEIRFRVNSSERVAFVAFKVDVEGAFCEGTVTWEAKNLGALIRADGTFKINGSDGLSSFTVRGDFIRKNAATGTLKSSVIDGGCVASGRASWTARRIT